MQFQYIFRKPVKAATESQLSKSKYFKYRILTPKKIEMMVVYSFQIDKQKSIF